MIRNGLLAAGNFIIDIVKMIDAWPHQESLVHISTQERCNGGGAFNVLKDLALMDVAFPLEAMGCLGKDEYGQIAINDLKAHNIDTSLMQYHPTEPTSFTDVMTVMSTGKRTFFHNRGANRYFQIEDDLLKKSNAKIFYLAYLMLLDHMDSFSDDQTYAAKAFAKAKALGFITATDIVSVRNENFPKVVSSSLPYVDYLFINELEAELLTGIPLTNAGKMPDTDACISAGKLILDRGVNCWVILHFPHGAIALNKAGEVVKQGSIKMPPELIKGAVGAGDAFAAGTLAGIHQGSSMSECLKMGVVAAAACLQDASCSAGLKPLAQSLPLAEACGFREL
ncbi:MAG TPA: carbohydrate kinase family protein [Niabella sp.]|nr:carbohydrate kinase family protein [Niabella sp.]